MQFIQLLQENSGLFYFVVALLSLCVGSFINVVIYRLPKIMEREWQLECQSYLYPEQPPEPQPAYGLSTPASACPNCQHKIRWYENIPVISWLVLKGKCRGCHQPISIRYPLVEIVTMLGSLIVAWHFGASIQGIFAILFTWVLIALTGIDFDTQLLPDRLTFPLAGLGLAVNSYAVFVSPTQAIWGCLIGFLCLWVVYILFKIITGKEGMGYGDFKLLAALGAWMGPLQLPLIILLSSLVGAIIGIILLKITKENRPFAFGPYLAIAGWIALIWGEKIMHIYLGG
ncbi:prepilin peptidase [Acinetobacter qingfengensis]|uniref:Prepilin leader peptidase/N-methyltransferase n=1 Tax=Acinetobacter qingfengensis TaxID=1262585 RepID=A0A1E7RDX7_9GAMM|nr:A24 family peptidase [Acinetobacter qingfengensis]KAA8733701.1 prepilin peptidase [Acinetobacter qingfengensis]OEY97483.1 methyltransferase [Acinetobacter qingfengensis]